MILRSTLEEAMYTAMRTASVQMPPDVRAALEQAAKEETDPMARRHLTVLPPVAHEPEPVTPAVTLRRAA